MRPATLLAALALCVAACSSPDAPLRAPGAARADLRGDGDYIVRLRKGAAAGADLAAEHGAAPRYVYRLVFQGFAARLTAGQAAALAADPRVLSVTPDGRVYPTTDEVSPSWGLDRVDQRTLPLNGVYAYADSGAGVTVYDIDTGIDSVHSDFAGRVGQGTTFVADGNGTQDCNGHGTHTAGTIGGRVYGVAKGVTLVPVRVFGCSGGADYSTVIAAVEWVTANAHRPAVVNMSLGGPFDQATDDAVAASIAAGIVYSISAGNSGTDACTQSPAATPAAITVGATDINDAKPSWSNFGPCVDLWAPGVGITSDWYTGGTAILSGTSMAAPHVTGAAARVLGASPGLSPAQVDSVVKARSTKSALVDSVLVGDLLYTGYDTMAVPPPSSRPTADFTWSCVTTRCAFRDASTTPDTSHIVSWNWRFDDNDPSSAQNPSAAFHYGAQPGQCCTSTHVTLSVVNSWGLGNQVSKTLNLISPIALSAAARRAKGTDYVDLTWAGARGDTVLVYRQAVGGVSSLVSYHLPNTGRFTDQLPKLSGRTANGITWYYSLCEFAALYADWQCAIFLQAK
jgi:hypothetical protein